MVLIDVACLLLLPFWGNLIAPLDQLSTAAAVLVAFAKAVISSALFLFPVSALDVLFSPASLFLLRSAIAAGRSLWFKI